MTEFDPNPADRPAGSAPATGFEFNNPTIINLLYLASYITGITGIVGVVLAYVWRGEPKAQWEVSHYEYAIRTFWIFLVGMVLGFMLMVALIGFVILPLVSVLVIVRSVMSILKAQKQLPMPNPGSWLV
ncbi:membrane protein [Novosphingobium sp. P6W]|uniref:DUF4870 family protein n=1 Tax=Novosphingobium sp. P6W TaxID=1609758 RepID=UPI0005C2D07F|nr:membrane protein [Novosphingobium sp. P6W]AXB75609.1 hypothetical protein TQ38_003000 [Novosphingobium sp. P6W]KIS29683.1 membrane protein [Novosphingobium sp. P6W]